jgi:hypothetical protein
MWQLASSLPFWSYFVVIFRVGVDVLYRRAIRTSCILPVNLKLSVSFLGGCLKLLKRDLRGCHRIRYWQSRHIWCAWCRPRPGKIWSVSSDQHRAGDISSQPRRFRWDMDTNYGKLTKIPNIPETGTLLKHGTDRNLTIPLDLYNHYWSTTHTCVEQFSHHHACVPGSPVTVIINWVAVMTFILAVNKEQRQ